MGLLLLVSLTLLVPPPRDGVLGILNEGDTVVKLLFENCEVGLVSAEPPESRTKLEA